VSWRVLCGDAFALMRDFAPGSFDAVIADPPYNIGYSYATYRDDLDWQDYFIGQLDLFREAGRLLRDGGSILWLNYPEVAARLWAAVIEDVPELNAVEWLTWVYHQHTGGSPFRKGTRAWLWFAKGQPYVSDDALRGEYRNPNDARIRRLIEAGEKPVDVDWWLMEQVKNVCPEKTEHPCQIPEAMVKRLVSMVCPPDGKVLDPYVGSGTTGVACAELGRDFVGIELDPGYCAIARKRIDAATRVGRLEL
jgi:site-specific DNA-methyltransferase (adenine-specific)